MDKRDWNLRFNGVSNLNEGEYTNFILNSIEQSIPYQYGDKNSTEKAGEIKF